MIVSSTIRRLFPSIGPDHARTYYNQRRGKKTALLGRQSSCVARTRKRFLAELFREGIKELMNAPSDMDRQDREEDVGASSLIFACIAKPYACSPSNSALVSTSCSNSPSESAAFIIYLTW